MHIDAHVALCSAKLSNLKRARGYLLYVARAQSKSERLMELKAPSTWPPQQPQPAFRGWEMFFGRVGAGEGGTRQPEEGPRWKLVFGFSWS